MPTKFTHEVEMSNGWVLTWRDWTRGEVRDMSYDELANFIWDQCIVQAVDPDGDTYQADELPASVYIPALEVILDGIGAPLGK